VGLLVVGSHAQLAFRITRRPLTFPRIRLLPGWHVHTGGGGEQLVTRWNSGTDAELILSQHDVLRSYLRTDPTLLPSQQVHVWHS